MANEKKQFELLVGINYGDARFDPGTYQEGDLPWEVVEVLETYTNPPKMRWIEAVTEKQLMQQTRQQLEALAEKNGIDISGAKKKADVAALIAAAEGGAE